MPLPTEDVRAIAVEAVGPMKHALWLGAWRITVKYGRLDDGCMAQVHAKVAYQQARITIDPEQHETKADVLDSVRHELLHLVCAYFDHAHDVVAHFVSERENAAMHEAMHLASEHSVSHMERFLDGFGLTPAKLVSRGKRELGVD